MTTAPHSSQSEGLPGALIANLVRRSCIGDLSTRGAEHFGDRPALVDGGTTVTYRQLEDCANSVARGLLAAGAVRGDRLAVAAPNCWQLVVTFFACAKTGVVFVPINYSLSSEEIAFQLTDSSVKTMVVAEDFLDKFARASASMAVPAHLVVITGNRDRSGFGDSAIWESFLEQDSAPVEVIVDDTDVVQCLYTSGTTSNPKGVLATHNSVFIAVLSNAIQMRHQRDTTGSVMPIVLPMFHAGGLDASLLPLLATGGTAILFRSYDPDAFADAIETFAITHLILLPVMWESLVDTVTRRGIGTESVRLGIYTMANMAPGRVDRVRTAFPNADVVMASGQTETIPANELQWPGHQFTKQGAWGSPTISTDIRIMDDKGTLVARGVEGEIVTRTPQLMTEYWNNPAANSTAFAHGWFHSGDIGYIDDDGVIWFTDRLKDIVKTGGENVSSIEVEQLILSHPSVGECAVVGREHERWGEAVTAIVVVSEGSRLTEFDLVEFCKERLAGYKVPKRVIFVDSLPRTATGKIEKHKLRAP